MDTQNKGADPFANIFQQAANISKAHAYDIVAKQRDELVKENEELKKAIKYAEKVGYETSKKNADLMVNNEELKKLKSTFYMDICRAYNAGKQNMINAELAKGTPDEGKLFLSSHDYFITEFPEFKTNVP